MERRIAELRTVLLVEDNPGDALIVRELLDRAETPTTLRWAERLDDGLAVAIGADVVLLDLGLPDSSGIDTVRRWRDQAPDLPVVVLTGTDDEDVAHQAIHEGAQDFLAKSAVTDSSLRRVMDHAYERHAILRRLEHHRDELAQAVAVRDEVLATATHELRSPLGVLRGVAALLGERGEVLDPGRRRDLLEVVARQTARLEELVGDLIELARHQAGGAPPEPVHLRIGPLVDRAVEDVFDDPSAVERRIGDIAWETDGGWLRRILVNLLSNAAKYGRAPVVVSAEVQADHLILTVGDRGDGVPDDLLPTLFDPFTRATSVASLPGSGLGLAIVARLAAGLGGSVTYAPPADGGARFVLRLPRLDAGAWVRSTG